MPNIGCSPNAAIAFDFFIGKGLKDFQAAGVIGNLQIESGMDPTIHQIGGGPGIGIAQWGPPRWKNLNDFASASGSDPWALATQLEFIWHELETDPSAGLSDLQASETVEDAVTVFQDQYEICGTCMTSKRIAAAQAALYACPSLVPPPPLTKPASVALASVGALGLAVAAGWGTYEARRLSRRKRRS